MSAQVVTWLRCKATSASGWLLLSACVSHVPVVDTPCPCSKGFLCCPTLSLCLPNGQECPQTYPSSSGQTCQHDQNCPIGELCLSWSISSSSAVIGPQECRRACAEPFPCADSEVCAFTFHDGQRSDYAAPVQLCVNDTPSEECGVWQPCTGCADVEMRQSFCQNDVLTYCVLSADPHCGVSCAQISTPFNCHSFPFGG